MRPTESAVNNCATYGVRDPEQWFEWTVAMSDFHVGGNGAVDAHRLDHGAVAVVGAEPTGLENYCVDTHMIQSREEEAHA